MVRGVDMQAALAGCHNNEGVVCGSVAVNRNAIE